MAEVTERIASLESTHKYLATKEDVAKLKEDIAELKGELKGLATKEDVAELKGEVRMAIKAMSIGVPVVLVLIQIVFKYAIP